MRLDSYAHSKNIDDTMITTVHIYLSQVCTRDIFSLPFCEHYRMHAWDSEGSADPLRSLIHTQTARRDKGA